MHVAIRIINPSIDYQDEYLSFYDDWIMSGEDIVPWVVEKDPMNFKDMIEFLYSQDSEEKIIDENWVPHSTLWLVNEEDKIVGAANIRHRLRTISKNGGQFESEYVEDNGNIIKRFWVQL